MTSSSLSTQDIGDDEDDDARQAADIISRAMENLSSSSGEQSPIGDSGGRSVAGAVTHDWPATLTTVPDDVNVVAGGCCRRLCGTPGLAPRIPRLMQPGGVRNLYQHRPPRTNHCNKQSLDRQPQAAALTRSPYLLSTSVLSFDTLANLTNYVANSALVRIAYAAAAAVNRPPQCN